MSGHYKTNKKHYFINLRSGDANSIEQSVTGQNWHFTWLISNFSVSSRARMAIVNFCHDITGDEKPYIIRCAQVKNEQYAPINRSQGCGALIYAHNELKRPYEKTFYPLNVRDIDRIDLYFSDVIGIDDNGINNGKVFLIQLEIEDYDIEEVDEKLMPTYNKKSLSYHY